MVCVAEYYLGFHLVTQFGEVYTFDSATCADGHEYRCLYLSMRCRYLSCTCRGVCIGMLEYEIHFILFLEFFLFRRFLSSSLLCAMIIRGGHPFHPPPHTFLIWDNYREGGCMAFSFFMWLLWNASARLHHHFSLSSVLGISNTNGDSTISLVNAKSHTSLTFST